MLVVEGFLSTTGLKGKTYGWQGAWKPSLNIPTVLTSIGLLLSDPNPDDGLMGDIVRPLFCVSYALP